jgi:mannose-6-phosphate isomerase-like protein (cupin superfamily)
MGEYGLFRWSQRVCCATPIRDTVVAARCYSVERDDGELIMSLLPGNVGGRPDSGSLEVIVPDGGTAIRWTSHGYPNSLAKWHYHPQIEIHLIREGSGQFMAGDGLMSFEAGHVALIGSNLPHNWISDIRPGERLAHRDVLCHVRPQTIRMLSSVFPETAGFEQVLRRALHAVVLSGESARQAADLLVAMGEHDEDRRVADLIAILSIFEHASPDESRTLVTPEYNPMVAVGAEDGINAAISYISKHLDEGQSSGCRRRRLHEPFHLLAVLQARGRHRLRRLRAPAAHRTRLPAPVVHGYAGCTHTADERLLERLKLQPALPGRDRSDALRLPQELFAAVTQQQICLR